METVNENVGFDICYKCGIAQEYLTMSDIIEDDFDIFCDKCLPTELKTCMHCDIEQVDFIIEDNEAIILGHYCGGKAWIESYSREQDVREYLNELIAKKSNNNIT